MNEWTEQCRCAFIVRECSILICTKEAFVITSNQLCFPTQRGFSCFVSFCLDASGAFAVELLFRNLLLLWMTKSCYDHVDEPTQVNPRLIFTSSRPGDELQGLRRMFLVTAIEVHRKASLRSYTTHEFINPKSKLSKIPYVSESSFITGFNIF